MNNLEKELEEIFEMIGGSGNANKLRAQCAAKHCLKWIQDGFHFAYDKGERGDGRGSATEFNDYLSERGLTPTEPDTKEWELAKHDSTETGITGSNGIINAEYKN